MALVGKALGSRSRPISGSSAAPRGQNSGLTSVLTGLKAIGTISSSREPALGELMNSIVIAAGEDHTRLSMTFSRETVEKLARLVPSPAGDPGPDAGGAGEEWQALSEEAHGLLPQG
ncbi:MAG: hypothetical protein M0C28_42035 [Candidatus Moduliflexus flocculans]|nr:hypothetical protein [Candidatus Moduliflexus flocculans]